MKAFNNKTEGIISFLDLKRTKVKVLYWLIFTFLILICCICFFPIVWLMLSSLKDMNEFLSIPPTFFPKSFHPEKLVEGWKSMNFMKYYKNTFILAGGELVFTLVINGIFAYVLSCMKPKGHTVVFSLVLWTLMMPTSINMIPLFKVFLDFPIIHANITNSYVPLWLMAGVRSFYVLMFKNYFDSIPSSYVEAARLDGCGPIGIFARIIVPLSKPILVVVAIQSFNASWQNFLWPYIILKNVNLHPVLVKIFTMKDGGYPMDMYVVALVFAIMPPVIIYSIFQKQILAGANMSGVKG